jgi:hypothetical protein
MLLYTLNYRKYNCIRNYDSEIHLILSKMGAKNIPIMKFFDSYPSEYEQIELKAHK